jgi:hypothetical protein
MVRLTFLLDSVLGLPSHKANKNHKEVAVCDERKESLLCPSKMCFRPTTGSADTLGIYPTDPTRDRLRTSPTSGFQPHLLLFECPRASCG